MTTSIDKIDGKLFITVTGVSQPLAFWARVHDLKPDTLYRRIHRGWSVLAALYLPLTPGVSPRRIPGPRPAAARSTKRRYRRRFLAFAGKVQPMADWARERGMAYSTLAGRLRRGYSDVSILTTPTRRGPKPDCLVFRRAAA